MVPGTSVSQVVLPVISLERQTLKSVHLAIFTFKSPLTEPLKCPSLLSQHCSALFSFTICKFGAFMPVCCSELLSGQSQFCVFVRGLASHPSCEFEGRHGLSVCLQIAGRAAGRWAYVSGQGRFHCNNRSLHSPLHSGHLPWDVSRLHSFHPWG